MFRAILPVLSLLVILFLPRFGHGQAIRISYAGTSGYNVPIWVTHEAGLFKKYGLNSELIMGCAGGARALRVDAIIGSIEEGKKADLTILNPSIALAPRNALVDELALCENGNSVESVFVDGHPVLVERKITAVDEAAIRAELADMEPKIARAKNVLLQSR